MSNAQASCVVSVDVTSSIVGGPYTNNRTNIGGTARITNNVTPSTLSVQGVPSLNKAFGTNPIGVGQISTFFFTIPSPPSSPALPNPTLCHSFTAGLVIAPTPNVVN